MQTKHFFNEAEPTVQSALHSLTLTNPTLALDEPNKVVYRRADPTAAERPKVSIVSGGGAGHEPAFAGLVGKGMLTASVAGTIFASPSAEQVRRALMRHVETSAGVLVMVMKYTGDVLNFGMAAETARAAGIKAEFYSVGDDVGVGRSKGGKVGRRGIAGGIMTLKIAGALAEAGGSLEEVYNLAQLTASNTVSVGSSLEHVHIPGRPVDSTAVETIPPGETEIGMGIHNEPGSHRTKAMGGDLIKIMLRQLLDLHDKDRAFVQWGPQDRWVLLINNLGGLSTLELSAATAEVSRQLKQDYNISPVRTIQGTFLTSLNSLGFSVSLLKLVDTGLGPGKSMLDLLDAPAEAIGWPVSISKHTWEHPPHATVERKMSISEKEIPSNVTIDPKQFVSILGTGLKKVIETEPLVTKYDTVVGDGDCGVGLKRGAENILSFITHSQLNDDAVTTVRRITGIVETSMDGTSGALYAIFVNALAHGLRQQGTSTPKPADVTVWANALESSRQALAKYTPAQPGDRTLMDALSPFIQELAKTKDVDAAAKAAEKGTEATKNLQAKLGRSVYVGGESEWLGKIPDPGAVGLSAFFTGIAEGFKAYKK